MYRLYQIMNTDEQNVSNRLFKITNYKITYADEYKENEQHIPDKLAKFIGVESGIILSIPIITYHVWNELKKRNLFYKKDRRIFRIDEEI